MFQQHFGLLLTVNSIDVSQVEIFHDEDPILKGTSSPLAPFSTSFMCQS